MDKIIVTFALIFKIFMSVCNVIISDDFSLTVPTSVAYEDIVSIIPDKYEEEVGYIFIGDSRFVGMENTCKFADNERYFSVAKISQGYKWLKGTALPEVDNIVNSNNTITSWHLIIGLGVNDLYNINKYLKLYEDLSQNYDLILVSVNPIEYHDSITNKDIESFNNKLKTLDCTFIDTYSFLKTQGYSTVDGIHYTDKTYKSIFRRLRSCVQF